jgi:transcriptional regulator with XRE-family HTH domain
MALDLEKLNSLAKPTPEADAANAASRKENREWLELAMQIAIDIRYALRVKGMTQTDLADLLGTSNQNVAKWLSGKQNFTLQSICRIEKALGINLISAASLRDVVPDNKDVIEYTVTALSNSNDTVTYTNNVEVA